MSMFVIKTGRK